MESYQNQFIQLALKHEALKFGSFTLKSGRQSPYFFNAGQFHKGSALAELGRFYATALLKSGIEFDMLFGPAYKGIPLASAVGIALNDQHQIDVPYCFNRKEAKDHGEGGNLVGAPLQGKVVIVDDVITAGTAVREVLHMISQADAEPAAILIGLDRQEKGQGERSAIQELQDETGVPVVSIIKLNDIMTYLASDQVGSNEVESNKGAPELLEKIVEYRNQYGV